jgi:hypothetical protein
MAIVLEEVSPGLADYDGLLVVFTWGVPLPAPISWRGIYSPSDAGTLEMPAEYVQHVGVYGETGLAQIYDQTGLFRARFLPSSPTVTQLEAARSLLSASTRRGGPFLKAPLAIADLNAPGRTAFASQAWIEGPPRSVSFGRSPSVLEYTFLCDGVGAFLAALLPVESAAVTFPGLG